MVSCYNLNTPGSSKGSVVSAKSIQVTLFFQMESKSGLTIGIILSLCALPDGLLPSADLFVVIFNLEIPANYSDVITSCQGDYVCFVMSAYTIGKTTTFIDLTNF